MQKLNINLQKVWYIGNLDSYKATSTIFGIYKLPTLTMYNNTIKLQIQKEQMIRYINKQLLNISHSSIINSLKQLKNLSRNIIVRQNESQHQISNNKDKILIYKILIQKLINTNIDSPSNNWIIINNNPTVYENIHTKKRTNTKPSNEIRPINSIRQYIENILDSIPKSSFKNKQPERLIAKAKYKLFNPLSNSPFINTNSTGIFEFNCIPPTRAEVIIIVSGLFFTIQFFTFF